MDCSRFLKIFVAFAACKHAIQPALSSDAVGNVFLQLASELPLELPLLERYVDHPPGARYEFTYCHVLIE